ncbi:MAG: hypothetical protein IPM54_40950 [Polyangiaceae bacterium]|nr:hypothetical protein [Polyangiaceae bacterium]
MPLETALAYAAAVARALAVLAAQGVVHRDITPRSILVREHDNAAFLVHFTSAGRTGDESLRTPNPDAPKGTLVYMAPEQTGRTNRPSIIERTFTRSGPCSTRNAHGQPPFTSQSPWRSCTHLARAPKPPHELEPSVPPAISRIVRKLLAKSADDRYKAHAESPPTSACASNGCVRRDASIRFHSEDKTAPRCSPPPCVSTDATPA